MRLQCQNASLKRLLNPYNFCDFYVLEKGLKSEQYSRIFAFSFVFSIGCKYLISKYAVSTFNIFPFHSQQLKEILKLFLDTYVNYIDLG